MPSSVLMTGAGTSGTSGTSGSGSGTGGGEAGTSGTSGTSSTEVVYASRLDLENTPILYAGEAAEGSIETNSVWRIWRVDISVGSVKKWANGNSNFINKWTDREILEYT
jgi:hypothetical protein